MTDHTPPTDPIERLIFDGLVSGAYEFTREGDKDHPEDGLDFWLPRVNVHIECKRFHTPRLIEQCSRHANVILVQGLDAALALCALLAGTRILNS
jgi:hypothetical protein